MTVLTSIDLSVWDARDIALILFILIIIAISLRIHRARAPGPVSVSDGLQAIVTIEAIITLVGSYVSYKSGNDVELTKASVDVKRQIIRSINEHSRAAVASLASPRYSEHAALAMAKSTPISLKYNDDCNCATSALNTEDYFGYLASRGRIDETTVNSLRFSLVKLLNEFENAILLLNSGVIDCVQIFDAIEELTREKAVKPYKSFISQYDRINPETDRTAPLSWVPVQEFIESGASIAAKTGRNPVDFCYEYRRLYPGKDGKYLLYSRDALNYAKDWLNVFR
jgi:hypothetical protein